MTPDQLRAAAERIVAAHDLQGEMPGPSPPPPDWLLRFVRWLRHAVHWLADQLGALPPLRWLGRALAWMWAELGQIASPIGRLVVLALVIAIVCGVAVWLGDMVARRRRKSRIVAMGDAMIGQGIGVGQDHEARRVAAEIAIGGVGLLLVAAFLEGFVRQLVDDTPTRFTIGATMGALWLVYFLFAGRGPAERRP